MTAAPMDLRLPDRERSPYFVNAAFDTAFVGGLSTATYFALRAFGPRGFSERALDLLLVVVWFANYPHFSATLHRLFRTRENAAQYPFTAYVTPVVVGAATIAALAWPRALAPTFVKLMLLWAPYHLSGQTIGVTMIYARRLGVSFQAWERRALTLFVFGTYLLFMVHTSGTDGTYYGVAYPTLEVPSWFVVVVRAAMWCAAGYLVAFVVSWSLRNGRMLPPIVLLPAVTQFVWFVPGASVEAFFIFAPVFHSLQYMPIALAMQLGDRLGRPGTPRSPRRLAREVASWGVLNLAGGFVLFYVPPVVATWAGVDHALAVGVFFAAIQLHHFVADGVIWKLRNASVSSPLLARFADYARPAA